MPEGPLSAARVVLEEGEFGKHGLAEFEGAGVVIFYNFFVANVKDLPRVTALVKETTRTRRVRCLRHQRDPDQFHWRPCDAR